MPRRAHAIEHRLPGWRTALNHPTSRAGRFADLPVRFNALGDDLNIETIRSVDNTRAEVVDGDTDSRRLESLQRRPGTIETAECNGSGKLDFGSRGIAVRLLREKVNEVHDRFVAQVAFG